MNLKKLLSIVLCIAMIMSSMSIVGFADEVTVDEAEEIELTETQQEAPAEDSEVIIDDDEIITEDETDETEEPAEETEFTDTQEDASEYESRSSNDIEMISDEPVAKVGNTEYATIEEAISNWTNGTTLTLMDDVTLSNVITLKSTEHHILNLGTYTMTAASGKNAIVIQACGTGSSERSAITINADAANPGGIDAGSKCVVYYKYADGGISTEDRPIIKINGGVFTGSTSSWGTAGIYTIGTAARKCATLNITGGTFNCSINGSGKSKLLIYGGTFNYSVGSQGDSTCHRTISGGTFKSFGFMTADDNNTKFVIGTAQGNYNVGTYIDDNGYLVVGGAVVTDAGETFEASSANYGGFSSYLKYSSAVNEGLYYTSVEEAFADNNKASGSVTVYVDELDMTDISYKGTIVVPEGETIIITTAEGVTPTWNISATENAVTYVDANGNELVKGDDGSFAPAEPDVAVKVDGVDVKVVASGENSYDITLADGETWTEGDSVIMTFPATGEMAYVVHEHNGTNYIYVGDVVDNTITITNTVGFSTFTVYEGGLEEAFAEAGESDTIVLLADAAPTLTSQRAITKAAVIDLGGNTLTLTEDDLYFGTTTFKNGTIVVDPSVKASTAVFWMFAGQTLIFDDVEIIATGVTGTYLIGINDGTGSAVKLINGSKITIANTDQAGLTAVICDNGTGNSIVIEDSTINVANIEGRFYLGGANGTITVEDSTINANGVKEGFYLRAGQDLSIEGTSVVNITLNSDDGRYGINVTDDTATYTKADTATVDATVYSPAPTEYEVTPETFLSVLMNAPENSIIKLAASETAYEFYHWAVNFKNITIIGAEGATVNKFQVNGTVEGLVFENVVFTAGVKFNDVHVNGLTFDDCTFNVSGVAITAGNSASAPTATRNNVTIQNCIFNGSTNSTALDIGKLTGETVIMGNTFTNVRNAFQMSADAGSVLIDNNTITNTSDRAMRLAEIGENVTVTISNNIMTNACNSANEFFKVTSVGAGSSITFTGNTYNGVAWNPAAIGATSSAVSATIPVAEVNGVYYGDIQEAIVAAAPDGTVEILADITVDQWIMFAETMSIGNGKLITLNINGLTINGNGKTLTIKSIESAGNGNRLFYDAQNLTINNLTIAYVDDAANQGGIGLQSGTLSGVNFVGGGYGVLPGDGEITITGCNFQTNSTAIYYEVARDDLVVNNNTFELGENVNVILLRGDTEFTNNTIVSGRTVNIVSGSPVVTGNDFGNVRLKVYNEATATINNNEINVLTFNDETAPQSTFTNNTLSAEAEEALDAVTAPAGPIEVASTEELQAALDAATDGTTIQLKSNTTYDVVYMGRPTKSNDTTMYCETHDFTTTDAAAFAAHLDDGNWHTTPKYTTNLTNVTIIGAEGATVAGVVATSAHCYGDVYDYVLDKDYDVGSAYYNTLYITNLTFSGVNFVGKVDINTSDADSIYDGVTFDNCTFTTGGTASTNGAAIRYYNEANNGNVKNITVNECTFNNCYQGVYVHHVNGVTVADSEFTTTGHNAIALQSHNGAVDFGDVVISGNTFTNIGDRVIRFNDVGAGSNITITGNTATNSGNAAGEFIKATSIADGGTINRTSNTWNGYDDEELVYENGTLSVPTATLEGSGTAADPYLIEDIDDLKWFRDDVNAGNTYTNQYVKLTADIDLTSVENWEPIGNSTNKFIGHFDGGDNTISNLKINNTNSYIGLFGYTSGGSLKNLTLNNVDIDARLGVGALVGCPFTSDIDNIKLTGKVTIDAAFYVGGVAGRNAYGDLTNITVDVTSESYVKATSTEDGTAYRTYVGGVVGFLGEGKGVVKNVTSNIKVIGDVCDIGGIAGIAHYGNTFENVTFSGTVEAAEGATEVGGIAGVWHNQAGQTVTFTNVTVSEDASVKVGGADVTETQGLVGGAYNPENETADTSGSLVVDGKDVWLKVAAIGETKYATLEEAVAAAESGDTIKLLDNVTLSAQVTIPAGVTLNGNSMTINGAIVAGGDLTFAGHTKVTSFNAGYSKPTITIGEGATLETTSGRMVIGHGATFNITGSIDDAKTANTAELTPSLIAPGASFTGAGVNFNVTNAYVKFTAYCSSKNSNASGTYNIDVTNSIWDQTGSLVFSEPTNGMDPTFNFTVKDSVLNSTSHLVFAVTKGEIIFDNSLINKDVYRQLENRSNLTIKNGSVVYASVATSQNAINPGTTIVDNATYITTGEFSGTTVGTGSLILKNGATATVPKIGNATVTLGAGCTLTCNTADIDISTDAGYEVKYENGVYTAVKGNVAKIGDDEYATLEEAFKAATSGCTIEILSDVVFEGNWDDRNTGSKFTVPVTINGNNKTIKIIGSLSDPNGPFLFKFEADATVNNLIIDISEVTNAKATAISAKADITIDGCTFIGNSSSSRGVRFGEGAGANIGEVDAKITNSTFTNFSRGITDNENGGDAKSVTITGNTFNNANVYLSAFETVTFTGNTVTGGYVDIRSYTADNSLDVTATGNTLTANTEIKYNYINAGGTIDAQDGFVLPASGEIAYRAYVEDTDAREAVKVDLQNVSAKTSVVVKLYDSNDNLLITTTLKAGACEADWLTTNIVLSGTPSGSWDTVISAEKLTVANVPTKVELWIDGDLLDTFEPALGNATDAAAYQLPAYLALDCVYKEAKVNDTYFLTLAEAVAAAQDGETVELLADVELDAPITIKNSIIIDGNNKAITQSATCNNNIALLYFEGAADNVLDVTVKNATFDGLKTGAAIRTLYVNMTIDNCVFQNCEHTVGQGLVRLTYGSATIKNSKFLNNNCSMGVSFNWDAEEAQTVNDTLTIDNCEFTGNTANKTALVYYVKGIGCEIKNSEFNNNKVNCTDNGATIYLGFQDNCKVTNNLFQNNVVTESGTSTRVAGTVFAGYQATITDNVIVNNTASNGNSDTLGQVCISTYYEDGYVNLNSNYWGGNAPVYGVDYTIQHQTGAADYGMEDYYAEYTTDANGNLELSDKKGITYVATVGTRKFTSLAEAVATAQDGNTIVLLDDVALAETIKISDKEVTLDLNGKTITGTDNNTSGNFYLIDNRGTLTVKDSVGDGKITLTAVNNRAWNNSSVVIATNPGGKLVVESGTIEHLGGTDMAYALDNLTNGKGTYAETVINGGTIKSTYRAVRQFLNGIEAQNILTVNGGTVEGANKSIFFQDPSAKANSGTLTVNEDAVIKGDVYLFVTAGSTEWPVEVSIAAAALDGASTVTSKNVPTGYEVKNDNGTWGVEEVETFELFGANVLINSSLTMFFYIPKAELESGVDYYATITKSNVDAEATVLNVPMSEWESYNSDLYRVAFDDLMAYMMNDEIKVQIFKADGTAVSEIWTDSISIYANRIYEKENDKYKAALVDMLNYGAACQTYFGYDVENLANKNLTDEQKAMASGDLTDLKDLREMGTNYYGSSLTCDSTLVLQFYFTNISDTMTAKITYTDAYKAEKTLTIKGSEFNKRTSTLTGVMVGLPAYDAQQLVKCEVYDGETLVAYASDSIESYVARQANTDDVFEKIMKFALSSKAALIPQEQ